MYMQYFGLREPLFGSSDNPAGQYLTGRNKVVCEQLCTGLVEGKKVFVLTGVAGSGKTTLVRRAVSETSESCALIELQAGNLKLGELIDDICSKLSVDIDTTGLISQRITDLKKALQSQRIKHTVVLIENVCEIHADLIKCMLLLSRHELDCSLRIQFVVMGEPDRNSHFEQIVLRRFARDDICVCCIELLDSVDVASYVAHYLDQAGCKNKNLFTQEALEQIAKYSSGIPRLINLLCKGGLLAAFLEKKENVDVAMIDEASNHCLYFGTGNIQPVVNENEIELPTKYDSPIGKVSIVQGWPFENQQQGFEIEASSPKGLMFPESNDKQSSNAAIVEVEDVNSNAPVESVWHRLSVNGSSSQALQTNVDPLRRRGKQTQQSDNHNYDQDLNCGSADEFTAPKAKDGNRLGLSEMIKKASKFDFPGRSALEGSNGWAMQADSTSDLSNVDTDGTAELINTEATEKPHDITANTTTASISHSNASEYEWGGQPSPNEQNCALVNQSGAVDSAFVESISLSEIINKAADNSVALQSELGLSAKYSEPTDELNFDRQLDSWMNLKSSERGHAVKLYELVGMHVLSNSSGTWSNMTPELLSKFNFGLSGAPIAAGFVGEDYPSIYTDRPGGVSTPLSSLLHPYSHTKTQACGDELNAESTSSASKSLGSTLVALGLLALGLFVTFGSEKRPVMSIPNTGAEIGLRSDDINLEPVVKTPIESEHPKYDNETKFYSGLVAVETNKPPNSLEADNPMGLINRQPQLAKLQKHTPEVDIDMWLRVAEQQLSKKQLMTPENDNALASYRTILKVDPVHKKALSGIRKIKETYMLWARHEIRQGNIQQAGLLYQKALDVMPDDAEVLTALEGLKSSKTITAKPLVDKSDTEVLEFSSENEQIADFLDRANRQIYLKQLVTPAGNNALSTYRKVLRLDPRNSEALDGISWIKLTYLNWAKSAMDNHDRARAEVFYKRALLVDPTDRLVISMIRELQHRRDTN